ncbi:MAG: NADH-quinone oxidoreductase subunit N [Desulfomonilaceae bacterium]
MKVAELLPLLPILMISGAVILNLIAISFFRNHFLTAALTSAGLIAALLSTAAVYSSVPQQVTPLIIVDGYSIFFMALIFGTALLVTLLSYRYLELLDENREEYYLLLLLATLGSAVIVASSHFASFFLGLEILSVSLYALIAYDRNGPMGIEAGIKYLVLAATSDAFLLFGIALIYAGTGSLEFAVIAKTIGTVHVSLLLTGTGMLIVGLGFKLSLVPFHMWTPDVYEGAPAPISAFLASISKGAVFALMLRYFNMVDIHSSSSLVLAFTVIAVASMFGGNLLALMQNRVKRILAYSSIAHFGYLLTAFLAGGALSASAVSYYLLAYFVTILGAFGVTTMLSGVDGEPDLLDSYRGMFWTRPLLGAVFTAMLLSLAGIPLTAGFVGKFYVMAAGISSHLWLLVISLVVSSLIGLFYYLRIIATMFSKDLGNLRSGGPDLTGSVAAGLALALLTLLLVFLGIYPAPLIEIIDKMVSSLT